MSDVENKPAPKRSARPAHVWLAAGMGGLLLALFVLALQWKDSRKVGAVRIEGAAAFTEKEIRARAAVPAGALLDTVSLAAIRKRLVSHPYIREARVQRSYPDAVSIEVLERVPVATFTIQGAIRYIDEEGVVLPYMRSGVPNDLPGIAGIPELERTPVGKAVEGTEFFEALGILAAALQTDSSLYHLISEVDMKNGGDVRLYVSDNAVPIIFGRGDELRKFALLSGFWEKFAREGGPENLQYLDLRFNDQVVAKWSTKPQREG